MPQTKSAKKALKASQRRRVSNSKWRRKVHDSVKAIKDAITAGDAKKAESIYSDTQSNLDRAARRNIVHPNKVSRQKSRLKKAIARITKK